MLKKYAEVAVAVGLGVEAGDRVIISSPIQLPDFTRILVETAYEMGAESADVLWHDDRTGRARFSHGSESSAGTVGAASQWRLQGYESGASFLRVHAEDPTALVGVDMDRVQRFQRVNGEFLKPHFDAMGALEVPWTVISAPVPAWNASVYPDLDPERAEEMLWTAIFRACRIDRADPVGAWRDHLHELNDRRDHLTGRRYRKLRYSAPGSDLVMEMTDGVKWEGGGVQTVSGRPFAPNLPTEEVFTSPHRMKAKGRIQASKPLSYFGDLIEDFWFEVEGGAVVSSGAARGGDVLERILGTDDGSSRFGEAAMVPQSGAVAAEGLVWNNALYDENDACHIALGQSYPMCFEGGEGLSTEERLAAGLNQSSVHVDFVVGSPEMSVYGVDAGGSEEPIIEHGEWGFST